MSKNLKKDHHYDVIGSEYYSQGELWWVSISGEVWDVADKHGDLDRVKELAICELMYDHHEDLGMELLKYGNVWRRCQVVCEWLPLHSLEVKRLLAGVSVIPTSSDSFVKILRVKKVNGLDVKVPHVPRCGTVREMNCRCSMEPMCTQQPICPKCGRTLETIPLLTGFTDVCPECDK